MVGVMVIDEAIREKGSHDDGGRCGGWRKEVVETVV